MTDWYTFFDFIITFVIYWIKFDDYKAKINIINGISPMMSGLQFSKTVAGSLLLNKMMTVSTFFVLLRDFSQVPLRSPFMSAFRPGSDYTPVMCQSILPKTIRNNSKYLLSSHPFSWIYVGFPLVLCENLKMSFPQSMNNFNSRNLYFSTLVGFYNRFLEQYAFWDSLRLGFKNKVIHIIIIHCFNI